MDEPQNGLIVRPPGGLIVRPAASGDLMLLDPLTGLPIIDVGAVVDPRAAGTIARTPMVDDDGTGEYGTVINNAWKQEFYNQIDAALAANYGNVRNDTVGLRYLTLGNQDYGEIAINDLRPNETVVLYQHTIPLTIHSISTNGPLRLGQLLTFVGNAGMPPVKFAHQSTVQANAALRFSNLVTSAPTPIAGGGRAVYQYNGGTWLLVHHEQGSWITSPFAASSFYADSPMVWTVTAGNLVDFAYRLTGRTLQINIYISGSVLSGTAAPGLYVQNPAYGGFVSTRTQLTVLMLADAATGNNPVFGQLYPSAANYRLMFNKFSGTPITVGGLSLYGQITLQVN
jgi:hypothetical protein